MTEMQGVRIQQPLSIDVAETTEKKIERMIAENPVIIFSKPACCMCHVMRRLLESLGVHPTVIELDEVEMDRAQVAFASPEQPEQHASPGTPAVFIGGVHVGGLEGLMALHLSGRLVPMLRDTGASWL